MKNLVRKIVTMTLILAAAFSMTAFAGSAQGNAAFEKVNQIREANGLQPLTWDNSIEAAGNVRAEEISRSFSHTRPDGSAWYTADDSVLYGENLAEYYNSADEVVAAWMASPDHKANILSDQFTTGAISVYQQNGKTYWAEEFGM